MKVLPLRKFGPATLALGLLAGTAIGCSEGGVTDVPVVRAVASPRYAVTLPTPVQQQGQVCADGPAGTYTFSITETDPNNIGTILVGPSFNLTAGQCQLVASSNADVGRWLDDADFFKTDAGARGEIR